ncbi:MAG: hypothetical protein HGA76_04945 [Candidatus Firestonebacteria bacterium]|nr:hypothetical protein [Candidatus Firestonebacteria bacterium]
MIDLLSFNKTHKKQVQNYIQHVAVRIPTIFDFSFSRKRRPLKSAAKSSAAGAGKTGKIKPVRSKKEKTYYLLGDGAFGGLALHGLMVLKVWQNLFESIQAVNLHASDTLRPERLDAFAKLFKSKRFRRKGEPNKSELSSNT